MTVVAFDPARDLAVLHSQVPLGLPALPLTSHVQDGDVDAVFGHPQGGTLRESPARVAQQIDATGTDIYGNQNTRRQVIVLAADVRPGDSGGPLIDQRGRVAGIAFATDRGGAPIGYALSTNELRPVLDTAGSFAVGTGPCVSG